MSCCVGISIPRFKVYADQRKEKQLIDCIRCDNYEDFVNLFRLFHWNRKFVRSCVQLCVEKCQWRFLDAFLCNCVEFSTEKLDRTSLSQEQEMILYSMMEEFDTRNVHNFQLTGESLLFMAAKNGETQIVEYLLSVGYSPNVTFKSDECLYKASALHVALLSGHEETLKCLLQNKSTDHSLPYGEDKSVLHLACERHCHDLLEYLLSQISNQLETRDAYFRTPLQQAAISGCTQCVQQMLIGGADINAHGPAGNSTDGTTPLMLATAHQQVPVMRALLEHPRCDVNATDAASRMTALHRAADVGNVVLVTLLLEYAADPHPVDADGATPLSLAVNERHVDAALALLPHIGDPDPAGQISMMAQARGLGTLVTALISVSGSSGLQNLSLSAEVKIVTLKHISKIAVRKALRVVQRSNTSKLGLPSYMIDYLYKIV